MDIVLQPNGNFDEVYLYVCLLVAQILVDASSQYDRKSSWRLTCMLL
jgi:hypothetical protein